MSKPSNDKPEPRLEDLQAAYQQLCDSYHKIDDFRAKLLGFLPLATGTGVFLLLDNLTEATQEFMLPIGVFGFLITLGLFSYEIYGIKKCGALISSGKHMEGLLHIDTGQFVSRPQNVARVINEPFAAAVIYSTVLSAWTYLGLIFSFPKAALWSALSVFVIFFVSTLVYEYLLRSSSKIVSEDKPTQLASA